MIEKSLENCARILRDEKQISTPKMNRLIKGVKNQSKDAYLEISRELQRFAVKVQKIGKAYEI